MIKQSLILIFVLMSTPGLICAETEYVGQRLSYNNPGLIVDLGVGLWAIPLPMDGDGDNDLVVSTADVPYNGVYVFENDSSDVFQPAVRLGAGKRNITVSYVDGNPQVTVPGILFKNFQESLFDEPVSIPYEQDFYAGRTNQWKYGDYNGDGNVDLIFGVSDWREYGWDNAYDSEGNWRNGPLHGYVYWAENIGDNQYPKYDKAVRIEAGGEPIDVYGCPSPNLVDWDADGDMDLICGEFLDKLSFFENTGSRQQPVYKEGQYLKADDEVIRMELEMLQVTVFDWDQDNDPDIIVGQEDGRVALIENKGMGEDGLPLLAKPKFFKQKADKVKCGALVTPCSIDWDGDGDEDLICGNTAGFIEWIENLDDGNPPKWDAPKRLKADGEVIRFMAGENLSIQGPAEAKWGYTVPYAADWNMDGLPDIVVNTIIGKVVWFENTGTKRNPQLTGPKSISVEWEGNPSKPEWNWWNPKPGELVVQWRTRPVVLDLDHDQVNDLILIDHEGFLSFFKRVKKNGELVTLPGKRIFKDKEGNDLNLSAGRAGKSGRRKIDFVDWDDDGDLDLLINSPRTSPQQTRNIAYYENVSQEDDEIVLKYHGDITPDRLEGHSTSPTTCDWDGDGMPELLVGAEDGFFYYYPSLETYR